MRNTMVKEDGTCEDNRRFLLMSGNFLEDMSLVREKVILSYSIVRGTRMRMN